MRNPTLVTPPSTPFITEFQPLAVQPNILPLEESMVRAISDLRLPSWALSDPVLITSDRIDTSDYTALTANRVDVFFEDIKEELLRNRAGRT